MDKTQFLYYWHITAVQVPLTYLRVVLNKMDSLLRVISTQPLLNTLRQLHVRIRDDEFDEDFRLSATSLLPCMNHLQTFTFIKSLFHQFNDEWTFIETLTARNVMPTLQRANLTVAITVDDLNRIDRSALFTDDRRVHVRYAFVLNDNWQKHSDLSERIPRGSRYHPQQIGGAVLVCSSWPDNTPHFESDMYHVSYCSTLFCISTNVDDQC